MRDPDPFRLLDLPTELQLMVYECFPVKTTLYEYYKRDSMAGPDYLRLYPKSLPGVVVLSVSRQVRSEDFDIIERKLEKIKANRYDISAHRLL
jgi:hypothetical protein